MIVNRSLKGFSDRSHIGQLYEKEEKKYHIEGDECQSYIDQAVVRPVGSLLFRLLVFSSVFHICLVVETAPAEELPEE